MAATLSEIAELCRDSLELADEIELAGGPPPHRAAEFDRARNYLDGVLGEIEGDAGLGIAPLVAVYWVLAAAGVITAVAVVPSLIRGSRQVVETVGSSTSALVQTTANAVRIATYGAVALGAYWAARTIFKKTA